jgi:hypothetical protein
MSIVEEAIYDETNVILNDFNDETNLYSYTSVIQIDLDELKLDDELLSESMLEDWGFNTVALWVSEDNYLNLDCYLLTNTKSFKREWNKARKELLSNIEIFAL